jgi:hypothetical protein
MGDARRRGTYAERKAAPLGLKPNHADRKGKRAWRAYLKELVTSHTINNTLKRLVKEGGAMNLPLLLVTSLFGLAYAVTGHRAPLVYLLCCLTAIIVVELRAHTR